MLKKVIKTVQDMIKASWLCIKYPFLYPRNRFDGRHWHNWKIEYYLNGREKTNPQKINGKYIVYRETIPGIKQKAWRIDTDYSLPAAPGIRFMGKTKRIILSYPWTVWYYIVYFVYHYILPIFHCIPTYTEWDAVPKGWKKAFGDQYLADLRKQLIKDKQLYKFRITDIKEKYGTFRLYCGTASHEVHGIIDKYESLSYYTCIDCGKPATKLSDGWICPYCDEHIGNRPIVATRTKDGDWEGIKEDNAEN